MGAYGSKTAKPSYLMGVGSVTHACLCVCLVSRVLSTYMITARKWIRGVKKKLTKAERSDLRSHQLVKKSKRADGTVAVFLACMQVEFQLAK